MSLSRNLAERLVMALRATTIVVEKQMRENNGGTDADRTFVLGNRLIIDEAEAELRGETVTQADPGILA